MSEEEIIKIIEKELTFFRCTEDDIKFKDAIRGLLNLYNQTKKDLKNDIEARDILVQYFYNTKEDIKNIINNHYPDVAVQKILELLERKTDK